MNLPQFNAGASLRPTMGIYRANARGGRSSAVEVLPMSQRDCTRCRPSLGGGGTRACCEWVWRGGERVFECTSESCTPDLTLNGQFAFKHLTHRS